MQGLLGLGYADSVKEQNPIGTYLTSEALRQWNFGTLLQRWNLDQWDRIFERLPTLGASLWIFAVLLGIALWKMKLDPRLMALASVPVSRSAHFLQPLRRALLLPHCCLSQPTLPFSELA